MVQGTEAKRGRRWLSAASRSRHFLWKVSIGTIALSLVVGFVGSRLKTPEPRLLAERILARAGLSLERPDPDETPKEEGASSRLAAVPDLLTPFCDEVSQPSVEFQDVMRAIPLLAPHFRKEDLLAAQGVLKLRFNEARASLLIDYIASWKPIDSAAERRLKDAAEASSPQRYASYAFARVQMERKHFAEAYQFFRREGLRPEAHESRYSAVNALVRARDFSALENLVRDPDYRAYMSTFVRLRLAAYRRDWGAIFRLAPRGQLESYEWNTVGMSIIAGCAWAFFIAHLGEMKGKHYDSFFLCAVAFILGLLSTVPTIYLVVIEEDILHLSRGVGTNAIFLYDIGGVGLREEFCKLLLFLPLLPFLVKRGNDLEALTVACFVGLGFAVEENAGYFLRSEASSVAGRFLSANFFHMALTGMNGLALFRALSRDRGGANDFLFVFPLTVLAHGIYDGLLDYPEADVARFFPMVVYIAFSLYFFRQVRPLRSHTPMTISLTGSFVFSLSVVAGAVIVYQMVNLGPQAGLMVVGSELLGSATLVFMFLREFDERLAA